MKKNYLRTSFALLLTGVMLLSSACGAKNTTTNATASPNAKNEVSSSDATKTESEKPPLKLKAVNIYNENIDPLKDTTLVELTKANVKKFVGRDVEIEWVTFPKDDAVSAQITSYVQMQDAAGTMPDLCYLLNLPFETEALDYISQKDVFREFSADVIKTNLPNYTRRVDDLGFGVDEIVRTNKDIKSDKLWGLPVEFRADTFPKNIELGMREYPNYGYYNVVFRDDILKQIFPNAKSEAELKELYVKNGKLTIEDYTNDIPIKNLDDLYDYMKKVKELDVKVGTKTVIPGAIVASSEGTGSLRWSFQTAIGFGWRWPIIWENNLEDSFSLGSSEKYYKPYIQWWNKAYNDGLFDPEMFIMKNDQYSAKAVNGEYAVVNLSMGGFMPAAAEVAAENGYGWRPFPVFYPVDQNLLNNKVQYNSVRTQQMYISSKIAEANLPDVYKYIDYFMTEEADDVAAWGSPDWYTGEGKDRRYVDGYEDLVNWSVYGVDGEKDGAYYGITAGVVKNYTAGALNQLSVRPIGLIQPSDGCTPYAPYYVYPRDNKELLGQVDLNQNVIEVGWDAVLSSVTRYSKEGWQESDYDSGPLWDAYDANLDPDIGNVMVKTIIEKPENFEENWKTYIGMQEAAGIREAEKDSAMRLKKLWDEVISKNAME